MGGVSVAPTLPVPVSHIPHLGELPPNPMDAPGGERGNGSTKVWEGAQGGAGGAQGGTRGGGCRACSQDACSPQSLRAAPFAFSIF